jgi:BirA family biotin operon repressor/biotin-[acetyl-CoA-carboxylase] ligase
VVRNCIAQNAREGLLVLGEEQTAGRGQFSRPFFSPPLSGLWFSLLLKPNINTACQVTRLAMQALSRTVLNLCRVNLELKEPNDLLWQGEKVAGVLAEGCTRRDVMKYVVLGIGVNVNTRVEDFPPALMATSLKIITNTELSREDLLADFLVRFEQLYKN